MFMVRESRSSPHPPNGYRSRGQGPSGFGPNISSLGPRFQINAYFLSIAGLRKSEEMWACHMLTP